MADIVVDPWLWSTTAASNSPSGATAVGTGLDDNLRALQAAVKSQLEALNTVAGTNTITATCTGLTAYATGQRFAFIPANTNTAATTLNVTSLGAKNVYWNGAACIGGELKQNVPCQVIYDGTQFNILGGAANAVTIPRSHLAGLTLSTAGSSATMTIAAGQAADSTNAYLMTLGSSIGKTTSAWALGTGNGGLDTGAIANSTWYHFYEIMRSDTGVVDVLFSLSASAPTMPSNYTYKRRIGSGLTNGSAQWVSFTQDGDYFRWAASVLDVNTTNPGTSAVTSTLTVPTGVNVHAHFNAEHADASASNGVYFSDLAATDETPSLSAAPLCQIALINVATTQAAWGGYIRTNTSAQIRYRAIASGASTAVRIATLGWLDRRGRDA